MGICAAGRLTAVVAGAERRHGDLRRVDIFHRRYSKISNTMPQLTSTRRRFALLAIAIFCIAALASAGYAQYGPDKQQPCPLCLLQRYGYALVALIALIGAIHGRAFYAVLVALTSAVGVGLAIWQVTKGGSMTSCREDPIGVFVNDLPSALWWPEYLFATGGCADVYPPLLGLSIPVWSLICFIGLTLVSLFIYMPSTYVRAKISK